LFLFSSAIKEGFKEAADKFGSETGICYPYDSESLNERIKIREFIESGKIEKAINLTNNLHPELIDNNRLLAFHLQVNITQIAY
jgi:glucose-induced degradation protein 8